MNSFDLCQSLTVSNILKSYSLEELNKFIHKNKTKQRVLVASYYENQLALNSSQHEVIKHVEEFLVHPNLHLNFLLQE